MSGRSNSAAHEHPLEALYAARDAAQRAASQACHVGILQGERTSYETVLGDLLAALGEISAQYNVTFPEPVTEPASGVVGARPTVTALLRRLPEQLAEVRGGDDPQHSRT